MTDEPIPVTASHWSIRRGTPRSMTILGIVDQGLSSITNFGVVVAAATALTVRDFGVFSAVYVTFILLNGASQALVGQDLVLATGGDREKGRRVRGAMIFTAAVSSVPVAGLVIGSILLPDLRTSLLVLALVLPLLLVQESIRFGCSLVGSLRLAVLLDAVWAAGVAMGVAAIHIVPGISRSSVAFLIAWGAAGAVSSLLGIYFVVRHIPAGGPLNVREHHVRRTYLGYRFIAEFVAVRGTSQSLTLVLGVFAGLAATGAFRGTNTLFGPLVVLLLAVSTFAIPIIRSADPRRQDPILVGLAGSMALLATLLTAVLLWIPDAWGERLLGATWANAEPLILPIGVQMVGLAVSSTAYIGLRMTNPTRTLPLGLIGTVLLLACFSIGYQSGGIVGAAWGIGAATWAQALLAVAVYLRDSRQRGATTVTDHPPLRADEHPVELQ